MKYLISLCLLICAAIAPIANAAQVRYISDNLFTYMHSGPGTQYRIIGSIDAGSKITLINTNKAAGFSQVTDDRGRSGWVDSKFVSTEIGLKERVPALQTELTEVKAKLAEALTSSDSQNAGLKNTLAQRNTQINDLETRNNKLQSELSSSQDQIRELRAKIDTQKDDLLMKWFTYGGLVAGAGLLFGLVLPHLIPRRRKRNNGWA